MKLIWIYGPPAAGKLTVARIVAARTGFALFHNHLVVDAVAAVFPFGSADFVRLRENFWIETIVAAARAGRSLVFTFNPEASVAADFPARVAAMMAAAGGQTMFVALTVEAAEQERRVDDASRGAFGKLRSVELLRALREEMAACTAAMPAARVTIDTDAVTPDEAAARIVAAIG